MCPGARARRRVRSWRASSATRPCAPASASSRSRRRPARSPRRYDILVIDEAQEMAPLELALIGRSLAPGGTLVVAGDVHQQTDPTTAFLDWHATMRELGCDDYASVTLEVGYRCP